MAFVCDIACEIFVVFHVFFLCEILRTRFVVGIFVWDVCVGFVVWVFVVWDLLRGLFLLCGILCVLCGMFCWGTCVWNCLCELVLCEIVLCEIVYV